MKPEVVDGYEMAIQPGIQVEAVKLVKEHGVAVAQAPRDLDIHENGLRKWIGERSRMRHMHFLKPRS